MDQTHTPPPAISKEPIARRVVPYAYLRLLQRLHEDRSDAVLWIDPGAQRLLDAIALKHSQGQAMTMMQVLGLQVHLQSSISTIARKVNLLEKEGLIEVRPHLADKRVKYVTPSEKAYRHYQYLSECLIAERD